ncbi:SDR family oxidoreductase [Amycolatopsis saalfeldensis]|uniref:NAD(P)-dependent dehydrogenase, short-chain alcohol dehydrogenase family n=1 Tax=Amycolatopsis saalfeldensis TaxID=394193 RepID=A0A1H8YDV0_9PSEU|nr:SDR family oxidoreductase [Amycolatopsis saalfeldensis]SEP50191.1 NAD(P)-dependent dehydrogenase, short-chain alcohol dehydrogenase family [Amycolatopsis saalfeldensis]
MTTATAQLDGRHVVVLGGTSGIGFATAAAAVAEGAKVTVVSSRQSSVDRALAQLPATATATGRALDLADAAKVRAFFDELGEFDHLVFTAGEPLALMPLDTLDVEAARRFFGLRYFGALTAAQAAVPHLREGGSITLTSGTAAARGGAGWGIASSICAAIEGLTRSLAVELAPLRVNAVAPGVVRSPLWQSMADADRERMFEETGAGLPAGRVGEPEDVARAYVYCMTQPWATGTVQLIDGGTVLA